MPQSINIGDEKRLALRKSIEDGSYFLESRKWFFSLNSARYIQQFYSLLLCLIMSGCAFIMASLISENYVVDKVPFVIYTDGEEGEIPFIFKLSKGNEDIQISLARYLISRYVKLREEYRPSFSTPSGYTNLMRRAAASSSRQVFDDFERHMNPAKNPHSPILEYRLSTQKDIIVGDIVFMPYRITPDKAIVNYQVIEKRGNKVHKKYDESVELIFGMSLPSKRSKFYDFAILNYNYLS